MRGGHANELQSTPCVIHDGSEHRQAAGIVAPASDSGKRNIQAAAKLSREASSWDILTLVSGARRRWYAVMHAEEQKCMCQ
jgi:hypothetical protein